METIKKTFNFKTPITFEINKEKDNLNDFLQKIKNLQVNPMDLAQIIDWAIAVFNQGKIIRNCSHCISFDVNGASQEPEFICLRYNVSLTKEQIVLVDVCDDFRKADDYEIGMEYEY